jgi:citrate synthase
VSESITVTDNRTGESAEIPIENGAVDAAAWKKLLPGTWFLDPAFGTTASTESAITFLDGDSGVLEYRGYPIEQLAKDSTHLEVAYLLLNGELPTEAQQEDWESEITHHTYLQENYRRRIHDAFRYDAHPMGLLTSSVAGLSTFYPESKEIEDPDNRMHQIVRLIAKMPTLAALAYRFSRGLPFVFPRNDLDYTSNFLSMMFSIAEDDYVPDPALKNAMEILFILHADHEQNCSTTAARVVGSAPAHPDVSVAAAGAPLYRPPPGGANPAGG